MISKLFGEEWGELLSGGEELLLKIASQIKEVRKTRTVIPEVGDTEKMFRVFREVKPSDIKCVVLGQEPYTQTVNIFDGLAFSCGNTYFPQPSLKNIIEEMHRCYPDNLVMDRYDWSYLTKQGVFPVNSALTAILKTPGEAKNLALWKPFTKFWIERLAEIRNDVCVLLWGNFAIGFKEYFDNGKGWHCICSSHPSPFSVRKTVKNYPPFSESGCFLQVNEFLKSTNQTEIEW